MSIRSCLHFLKPVAHSIRRKGIGRVALGSGKRVWTVGGALLLSLATPLYAQAPYVPDLTEAREKEWRKLVATSQAAYASGKPAEGVDPARKGLALADELFGADDPRTLISANDLALQLDSTGRYREAESLYRRAFDSYLRTRGRMIPTPSSPSKIWSISTWRANAMTRRGRWPIMRCAVFGGPRDRPACAASGWNRSSPPCRRRLRQHQRRPHPKPRRGRQ